ncbi:PAS domain S-box protein [Methanolobus sp. WCC4]|uniref:PAS domain-containing sensor histidine kinase n=1 Tax=Methanolobus sp. WCC4 TaxID=3125784 RepID=UPI0030F74B9F
MDKKKTSKEELERENLLLKARIKELEESYSLFKERREEEIHKDKTLLDGLLMSLPDLINFKDKEGTFIACNRVYADSFNLSTEEIIGRNDYNLHEKEYADLFRSVDRMVMDQGIPHRNEEWSTLANGKKVYLDTYKAPLYTRDGECIGILGVSRDITLQKKKEKELIRAHEQLISVMEAFDEPAYVADPVTYELLFVNNTIKKELGDDVVGQKCYKALQNFDSPCPFCTNHLIFGDNVGKTHIWETRNAKNKRWYRCIDKAIEWPDGRMVRFELAVDIHKEKMSQKSLRESEEKYKTYVNVSPHPIFVIDFHGNYVDVNPAACKVTGYSRKEILKMNLSDFLEPTNKRYYLELFKKLQSEGHISGEFPFIKKNGGLFYLEVQVVSIPENRFLALCTDSTEKRKAEERVLQAKIDAENANRTKSEFLANMSHELRTPLNSIIGFSDMLLTGIAGDINDKQTRYLINVSQSGRHLLDIINEILDISKIESGKMKLYKDRVALIEVYEEIRSSLQHLADNKGIKIIISPELDGKCVIADRAKLKQILYNLVGNAIKFTEDGGLVTIDTRSSGEFIEISVIDTGIGIHPEEVNMLFRPFVQLDSSEARRYEGTGLRLALSKELIELHGGRVWAESEPGKGSAFTFTIPACE